jgi:peptidoglycan/LPS O-acetylase OafA/YrhL
MHSNNFDFLRIMFAIFVMITYSFPLTLGIKHKNDWLGELTNSQINFSTLGLAGFFSISGYLIFESLKRSKTIGDYFRKCLLRIFPGLIVVLLITAIFFVFLSDYSFIEYFISIEPYCYILYNLNLITPPQGTIVDVIDNNPYPDFINGSLWTIRYEFLCYVLLSLLQTV